jgi:hypothetical protein
MFVGDDWHHAIANIGLTAASLAMSQAVTANSKPGTAIGDRFLAEYPAKGHTARSKPDE